MALPQSRSSNAHLFFNDQKMFPIDQTVSMVEMSHLLGDVFCTNILIEGISEESCVNQSRAESVQSCWESQTVWRRTISTSKHSAAALTSLTAHLVNEFCCWTLGGFFFLFLFLLHLMLLTVWSSQVRGPCLPH